MYVRNHSSLTRRTLESTILFIEKNVTFSENGEVRCHFEKNQHVLRLYKNKMDIESQPNVNFAKLRHIR